MPKYELATYNKTNLRERALITIILFHSALYMTFDNKRMKENILHINTRSYKKMLDENK